jgi:hypothetical protein
VAIYNKAVLSRTTMDNTATILQAVTDGDTGVVERLLTADPRLVRASDEYLKTPLHCAHRIWVRLREEHRASRSAA